MALSEHESQGESQPPPISIWQANENGEIVHHLGVGGIDTGAIDWEEYAGGIRGAIDGLDGEAELEGFEKRLAWLSIAGWMARIHPAVTEIQYPDGVIHIGEGFLAMPQDEEPPLA